ncbi:eukaryotic translation initiation factor 4 gamma 1-like [Takifugu rubripes]|uniref:eukaryotic translation initiation factor 4 gamma 1-like n=1 Tax=Takifugu rubripes TaxID=31033 RepID=UPI000035F564|nr:eukaryotic translation initiation factor 4 gamma 1-like [Takifugu rubripes]
MNTNVVPSIGSPQRGGEGDGRREGMTEKMIRTFRGILNKLTPEMFESLMNQVDELNIDTEERLNAVVELIVNKALSEQSYSSTYAKMCRHLKGLRVSSKSSSDFVYFRKVLLTRCRMEFQNRGLLPEKENDVSVAQEDLEQTSHKACVRLLGTVRFVGELFKLKMISKGNIHTCIGKLLQDESEESLECMCKLLTTVGKDLDTETEIPKINSYCGLICNLMKKKMSSRIKFMLQDVVALRENDWVPRRRDEGPKTIQQLHQEAKQAEEREMLQLEKGMTTMHRRGGGRPADRRQSFNVKEIPGKFNQDSSRDYGDRKQRCHLGSSSTFEKRNTWRPKQREPVVFLKEQNRGAQIQSVSKIPVEDKTQEEARAQDCDEEDVYTALKRLLQENSGNDQIEAWIQNTLSNRQRSSDGFVRALMRAVCQSVIVDCGVYTLNTYELLDRASLLKRFITDDHKQLVALNTVQQLVVHIDQPDGLLRMFFDVLWDEEVIQDETFFKWKSSAVSVVSLHNFFTWLQEANRRLN